MSRRTILSQRAGTVFLIFLSAFCAIEISGESIADPLLLIGAGPLRVYEIWGVPDIISQGRGEKKDWDYSVFQKDGIYLYWVNNRVWQVRFAEDFNGEWEGLHIGVPYPVVDNVLGRPWLIEEGVRVYNISGYDYPIQVRCFFHDDALIDVYIYRSNV